jgi:hypothetical protein
LLSPRAARSGRVLVVIDDAFPWREDLLKVADRLEQKKTQRRWTERSSYLVERDVMISAYAVRKLIEADKVSDEVLAQRVKITRHEMIGRRPDHWVRLTDEAIHEYEHNGGTDEHLSLEDLCNQMIHSWLWMLSASVDEQFNGVFVSSDRKRAECLYFIPVDVLIRTFRKVGLDDIVHGVMARDEHGEMQFVRRSSEPPPACQLSRSGPPEPCTGGPNTSKQRNWP